jgi:hypothetical protein
MPQSKKTKHLLIELSPGLMWRFEPSLEQNEGGINNKATLVSVGEGFNLSTQGAKCVDGKNVQCIIKPERGTKCRCRNRRRNIVFSVKTYLTDVHNVQQQSSGESRKPISPDKSIGETQ